MNTHSLWAHAPEEIPRHVALEHGHELFLTQGREFDDAGVRPRWQEPQVDLGPVRRSRPCLFQALGQLDEDAEELHRRTVVVVRQIQCLACKERLFRAQNRSDCTGRADGDSEAESASHQKVSRQTTVAPVLPRETTTRELTRTSPPSTQPSTRIST